MIYTDYLLDVLNFDGAFEEYVLHTVHHYGTLTGADRYLSKKIDGLDWVESDKKEEALVEATRLIDRLRFVGAKTDIEQPLEFPRNSSDTVPEDIERACYELAFTLIHNIDPDKEVQNQRVILNQYSTIKAMYTSRTQDHIMAGIPSIRAWGYLLPYLVHPGHISLSRVS